MAGLNLNEGTICADVCKILELIKPGEKLSEAGVSRNVFPDPLRHKRTDSQPRKLLEERVWMELGSLDEVLEERFKIANVCFFNNFAPIRIYEKQQVAFGVVKNKQNYWRGYRPTLRSVLESAESRKMAPALPQNIPVVSLFLV